MDTDFASTPWDEAVRSFLLHLKAVRAKKTIYFYDVQLRMLRASNRTLHRVLMNLVCSQATLAPIGKRFLHEGLQAARVQKPRPGRAQKITGDLQAPRSVLAWSDLPKALPMGRGAFWPIRGEKAALGHCAAKKETFYGYRLVVMSTVDGVITDWELIPIICPR